ncbi:unnamed protein product [Penicillium roqueforti FM164]|uniref:Genomic scaffold, ProqFM164S02 n=1 Tax=Penicillium roqueforti (strain FM164) TaxID=1365484 RepID=W6QT40_PENRF|nr:unnamed protein product [Penicillium roqueforti FM164]
MQDARRLGGGAKTEINLLDHQISMASGSTMALETTRPRLRKSKTLTEMSVSEMKAERMQQHCHLDRIKSAA